MPNKLGSFRNNEANMRFTFHKKHSIAERARNTFHYASNWLHPHSNDSHLYSSQKVKSKAKIDSRLSANRKISNLPSIKQNNVSLWNCMILLYRCLFQNQLFQTTVNQVLRLSRFIYLKRGNLTDSECIENLL